MPVKCDKQMKGKICRRPAKWVKTNDARYPNPFKPIYRCGYHANDPGFRRITKAELLRKAFEAKGWLLPVREEDKQCR